MRTCALLLMRVALSALNASRRNRHAISDRRATSQRQDAVKTDFTTETDFFVATSDSCFPCSFSPAISSLLHGLFLTKYSYSRFGISQSVGRWFFTEYSSDGSVIELWQNSIRKKENRKRSHTEHRSIFKLKTIVLLARESCILNFLFATLKKRLQASMDFHLYAAALFSISFLTDKKESKWIIHVLLMSSRYR